MELYLFEFYLAIIGSKAVTKKNMHHIRIIWLFSFVLCVFITCHLGSFPVEQTHDKTVPQRRSQFGKSLGPNFCTEIIQ